MKTYQLLFLLGFVPKLLFGQQTAQQSLRIGDQIPEMQINGVWGTSSSINLKTLNNGNLLIVNFWATWCKPCLKELPVLDSLAGLHKDKFKVISVTYESKEAVEKFMAAHPEMNPKFLSIVYADTKLHDLFPHRIIPHNIWIDGNGLIKAITGIDGINAKNISNFINQKLKDIPVKKDIIDFNMYKTFHLRDSDFIYRSLLSGYVEGIGSGAAYNSINLGDTKKMIRLLAFNVSKQELFWDALDQKRSPQDYYGLMKIKTADSLRFFWPSQAPKSFVASGKSKMEWKHENLYGYELTLPKYQLQEMFFQHMLNDLKINFKVDIKIENRKIPCALIYQKSSSSFKKKDTDSSYIRISKNNIKARNVSVLMLFQYLNERIKPNLNAKPSDPPYIDHTGLGPVVNLDIALDGKVGDFSVVKKMIEAQCGLFVLIKKRKYPHYIINDLEH